MVKVEEHQLPNRICHTLTKLNFTLQKEFILFDFRNADYLAINNSVAGFNWHVIGDKNPDSNVVIL